MRSGMFQRLAASAVFVISLSCEIAEAADPGFYVGAAGGRSEQRLDKSAGIGPIAIATLPEGGFVPVETIADRIPIVMQPYPPAFSAPVALLAERTADETDVGWNFALGYRVNKYFSAELAYVDAGEASLVEHYRPTAGVPTIPFQEIQRSYTVASRGPALSLLGSLPLSSNWELFARGGVLFAEQEVESRSRIVGGPGSAGLPIEREYSDEVVTLGAGVQWTFLPRWTARLEYQRTDDLQPNDIMGESRIDQASLSVLFGL